MPSSIGHWQTFAQRQRRGRRLATIDGFEMELSHIPCTPEQQARRQPTRENAVGRRARPHLSSHRERVVKACSRHHYSARGCAVVVGVAVNRPHGVGYTLGLLCASVWPHLLCIGMPFDSPQKVRRGTVVWPSDTSHKTSGRHSLGRHPSECHS